MPPWSRITLSAPFEPPENGEPTAIADAGVSRRPQSGSSGVNAAASQEGYSRGARSLDGAKVVLTRASGVLAAVSRAGGGQSRWRRLVALADVGRAGGCWSRWRRLVALAEVGRAGGSWSRWRRSVALAEVSRAGGGQSRWRRSVALAEISRAGGGQSRWRRSVALAEMRCPLVPFAPGERIPSLPVDLRQATL
jgi:hypothetical protein